MFAEGEEMYLQGKISFMNFKYLQICIFKMFYGSYALELSLPDYKGFKSKTHLFLDNKKDQS